MLAKGKKCRKMMNPCIIAGNAQKVNQNVVYRLGKSVMKLIRKKLKLNRILRCLICYRKEVVRGEEGPGCERMLRGWRMATTNSQ